jgi:hypothetical protein
MAKAAGPDFLEPADVFEHTLDALLAGVAQIAERAR